MSIAQSMAKLNSFIEGKENGTVFLDLGSRYIKAITQEQNKNNIFFCQESTGNKIKDAINLLKTNRLSAYEARIALKGPDTIIRYLPFPKMEKENLKESFALEAGKHLPFPIESLYFDLFVLDENYSKTESLILLAAAKKELIDPIIEDFEKEHITIGEISLSGVALINLYLASRTAENNYALIDIGNSSVSLNIFKNDTPSLSREIKTAGKDLIKKISSLRAIDLTQAEFSFIKGDNAQELLDAGEDTFLSICEEARTSFDYFEMNTGEQVQGVYLTGGFSLLNGLDKLMASALGLETKPWQPWEKLNTKFPDDFMLPKTLFATTLGLML